MINRKYWITLFLLVGILTGVVVFPDEFWNIILLLWIFGG